MYDSTKKNDSLLPARHEGHKRGENSSGPFRTHGLENEANLEMA